MARKSADTFSGLDVKRAEALADFEATSFVKFDIANIVYAAQDDGTRAAIDKIEETLRNYATATINVKVGRLMQMLDIEEQVLHHNLHYLAVEICKDLGLVDIQVGNFRFDESCVMCGGDV